MIAALSDTIATFWAPAVALLAGAVSFASPCVLPLVPGYVSFVTGGVATSREVRRRPVVPMLLFVAGFTVVFTAIGALVSATSVNVVQLFRGTTTRWLLGGFVIAMGLLMIGYALQLGPFKLYAERRPLLERARIGSWGAFPVGMAFGAGWTPCVGPVLGAILGVAATGGVARGAFLLVCYSLGLGVPFLLVGLGVERLMGTFDWVKRNYAWIAGVSGGLLVGVGILLATGQFTRIVAPLQRYLPAL
jgi:cytochrome c-type biogenesis protein